MVEGRTANRHRWGMLPASTSLEPLLENIAHRQRWEEFDHSQTLVLGDMNTTSIVFQKYPENKAFGLAVLRFCERKHFTDEKRKLLEAAGQKSQLFLSTLCVFEHNRKIFVGSELSDMSLADIIDCTIPLQEIHVATVTKQVISYPWKQLFLADNITGGGSS